MTRGRRLSILIYHRVRADPDPLYPEEVDALLFARQMALLARYFRPLLLGDAIAQMREGTLPPRAVAVTFDDGYADNLDVAVPILARYGVPATVFVATGYLDGKTMWNDVVIESIRSSPKTSLDLSEYGLERMSLNDASSRRKAADALLGALKYCDEHERDARARAIARQSQSRIPDDLMLTSEGLRSLRASGVAIGAHTVSHPILTRVSAAEARAEISAGRERLEELLDEPINLFAYPNGKPVQDFSAEHVELVRTLGFRAAVTTAWGSASATSDLYQLPRFTPWDRQPLAFALRLLRYRFAQAPVPIR